MSFRLVPNLVTFDDLERRNSHNRSVISPNSVDFAADYVTMVEVLQLRGGGLIQVSAGTVYRQVP